MAPGWASLIGVTMILGGSQLMFIGLIGQYLARVFEELKGRPKYILKQESPLAQFWAPAAETAPPAGSRVTSPLEAAHAPAQNIMST